MQPGSDVAEFREWIVNLEAEVEELRFVQNKLKQKVRDVQHILARSA